MTQVTASTASFTRPANTTTYAIADLVADDTTAGSVNPMVFTLPSSNFKLQRVSITKSNTTTTSATFRLHLYSSSPTVANGDNLSWSSTISNYLGDIDIDCSTRSFSNGGFGFGIFSASDFPVYLAVDQTLKVYGLLEAKAAYSPTSNETFTVTLYGETY